MPAARDEGRICAVVVTHNRWPQLQVCLEALDRQSRRLDAILVVDNACSDGTSGRMKTAFPHVEVLALEMNTGSAGGFHAGIARAAARGFDWIWTMDDDVEPEVDALAQLLAVPQRKAPETIGLASLKIGWDGRIQAQHTGYYNVLLMRHFPVRLQSSTSVSEVGYSSFVGLLLRGRVARHVLPRKDFFIWHDDIEYCLRLRPYGSLYVVPASRIRHHDSLPAANGLAEARPDAGKGAWRLYYALRNRLLIVHSHGTPWQGLGYGIGLLYLCRAMVKNLLIPGGRRNRLQLLLQGFADGVRGVGGARVFPT